MPNTTKNNSSYFNWLLRQKHRNDVIGDLASDVLSDSNFPKDIESAKTIRTYLILSCASSEAIQAFEESYKEYKNRANYRPTLSLKLRFKVFKRDEYKCQICGASVNEGNTKLEVDHKVPIAKGGKNNLNNLWTLCFECNRGKGKENL